MLCTDLDRTLIPNGAQPEHPDARACFREFCRRPEVTLVYVTGRHQALVREAIADYDLPTPAYLVADVGTRIYDLDHEPWTELTAWEAEIARDWRGTTHEELARALAPCAELQLQEQSKQAPFKLSYYLDLNCDRERVLGWVTQILRGLGVTASLVWSVDEPARIGLLDVLPARATKLHGIEFLRRHLHYARREVVFAGDSGNDLPVLAGPIPSVLVANADAEVKAQAQTLARRQGRRQTLYQAVDGPFPLGGNYAAGVLQGVWHFVPALRPFLQAIAPPS
ncbi:HAD-IIB family hydrolase [Geoalkalibacter sp.]|uniref:HAD-IIB family hydrolase n=1 Tax=Geoalkalibacter sp. TaxID=3041440 RepID=UPI00272E7E02|nr:HAD-IIB family hydrolase [Geoalkalibacter sp.]